MGYSLVWVIGIFGPRACGFSASFVINGASILAILVRNAVWFFVLWSGIKRDAFKKKLRFLVD